MNSIVTEHYPVFEMYQSLRTQLMGILSDADLDFSPGGANPSLGELCREIGEIEQSYINAFKTFTHDYTYRNDEPGLAQSVKRLSEWFQTLDAELKAVISALSEDDIANRTIYRGEGFTPSLFVELEVYKEALLIFYGKVTVYLNAMGKQPSEQWREWIA